MAFSELVGHQFVLVPLLLTGVQLLGQDQEGFLLTLQLLLTNHELDDAIKGERNSMTVLLNIDRISNRKYTRSRFSVYTAIKMASSL